MTTTNGSETKALSRVDNVRGLLDKMKPQLQAALPAHLNADRLVRLALNAFNNQPKLLDCDQRSLLQALLTTAALGLEPDGVLGQCYLVPYKAKVQVIVGYKGLILLARQSGEMAGAPLESHEVCRGDEFDYAYGLTPVLKHRRAEVVRSKDTMTHVYAIARFRDGSTMFEVMTRDEVEEIRKRAAASRGGHDGAWGDHYLSMARKTPIRRLAKYLPLSVQRAAALEDAIDNGRTARIVEGSMVEIDPEPEATEPLVRAGSTAGLDALAARETPTPAAGPAREAGSDDDEAEFFARASAEPAATGAGAGRPNR